MPDEQTSKEPEHPIRLRCPACGENVTFDTGWVQVKGVAKYRDASWHPACFHETFRYTDEGWGLS